MDTGQGLQRIDIIDSLRALALFGILVVHTHDHYNWYVYPPDPAWWDSVADWVYANLFLSKSFLLFSFLFGLSFYLQLSRAAKRGIDFRARFVWRLALLGVFGVLHTLFYDGDILLVFAVVGTFLVPLWRVPARWLLVASVLLLLRPTDIFDVVNLTCGWGCTSMNEWLGDLFRVVSPSNRVEMLENGTWWQCAWWNLTVGFAGKWHYLFYSGRVWQIVGLFVAGLALGKLGVFEHLGRHTNLFKRSCLVGSGAFLGLLFLREWVGFSCEPSVCDIVCDFLLGWANLCFVVIFVSFILWLSCFRAFARGLSYLATIGKTTLTCYVTQSLLFTTIFYGWGMGAAPFMGPALCLGLAVFVYVCQWHLAKNWLEKHQFGPLEYLWRTATHLRR